MLTVMRYGAVSGVVIACERPASGFLTTELTAADSDCDDDDANEYPRTGMVPGC